MKKTLIAAFLFFNLLLLGCSVKYSAEPITSLDTSSNEICVIEDKNTNEEFLPAYRNVLEKKGFVVRILTPGSDIAICPLTSTYMGNWSWDFVMYMAHAEIFVYKNGTKAGAALYDAPKAGTALTTEIYDSTETKIAKMVDKLFPNTDFSN
jgi:hypothetical protein